MTRIRHGDLSFDRSLLLAWRGEEEIHFSRRERKLLALFTTHPRQVLSRARLGEAIAIEGRVPSARHIDIVVHRLRAKLGDSARQPRFIANQRREGYMWIAAEAVDATPFVLVGPCFGLADPATAALAQPFLRSFVRELQALLPAARPVCLHDPGTVPPAGARFHFEAGFHTEGGAHMHAVCVLRDGRRQTGSFRVDAPQEGLGSLAAKLAQDVLQSLWSTLVADESSAYAPSDLPLELRMHEAGLLLGEGPESWRACSQFVSRLPADGSDPAAAIMRALTLYSQLVLSGFGLSLSAWNQMEDEIERLVLEALPEVRDRPLLAMTAAKLLLFIARGHDQQIEQLVDGVHARSTAFAAVFALRGQLLMRGGALAPAVGLFDKAIELAPRGSEFHLYLLVMKCKALMAADDRRAQAELRAELFSLKPATVVQLGLMTALPGEALEPVVEARLQELHLGEARALAAYLHCMAARHFQQPWHRRNVMHGLMVHLARRFDRSVIPADVAAYYCFEDEPPVSAPAQVAVPAFVPA